MESLKENLNEVFIKLDVLGYTINNRSIFYFSLTDIKNTNQTENLPIMLFTGVHHAREPLSLSMNIYLLGKILFDYYHNDQNIKEILSNTMLIFIPALNVDGYEFINEIYEKNYTLNLDIRKNRRKFPNCHE